MENLGIILSVAGFFALLYGLYKQMLTEQVLRSPLVKSGDAANQGAAVAGEKGAIAVQGAVVAKNTLMSPITNTECLYYDFEVKQSWKEEVWDEQEQKNKTETREVTLAGEKLGVNFSIDDGSGPVTLESKDGGLFDLEQTFKESKGAGKLLQSFSAFEEAKSNTYTFGQFEINIKKAIPNSIFKVYEKVLKPNQQLFVCGRVIESGAIGGSGRTHLIVSTRNRDKFLADAGRWMRELLYTGGVATPAGLLMFNWVVALVVFAVAGAGYGIFKKYRLPITSASGKITDRIKGWTKRLQKAVPA